MFNKNAKLVLFVILLGLFLPGCDSRENRYEKYLERGRTLFNAGEYKKARLEYKNASRIKPASAEVRYQLGLIDEAEGELKGAFANFIASEQQDPHYFPALIKLAQYFLAAEQYDQSKKRIDAILLKNQNEPDGRALNAAQYLKTKDYSRAEQEAKLALSYDPRNATAHAVLVGLHVALGSYDKATVFAEEGVKLNPQSLALLLLQAMVYEKTENLEKVEATYKTVFLLKPSEMRFRSDLAKVYIQAKKNDEAERVLRAGVIDMPESWAMKKILVSFLNQNKGVDAAEKEIKALIEKYPENNELVFWLADLYLANNFLDRAITLLERFVARDLDEQNKYSLNAQTSLARMQFTKGNRKLAEKLALDVLDRDPNNKGALFIRAQMLFEQGEHHQSASVLRSIVRDDPRAVDALQLLAEILLVQGHIDLSIDTIKQLINFMPTNKVARVRLAQLYAVQSDIDRSIEMLDFVTRMDPLYPVAWESKARVYIGAKRWVEAEYAIEQLGKIAGQEQTGQFLRGQLFLEQGNATAAITIFEGVVKNDPLTPLSSHALRSLYAAHSVAGNLSGMVKFVEELPEKSVQALTSLGDSHQKLGNRLAAIYAYQQAVELSSGASEPTMSLAQLYVKENKIQEAIALLRKTKDNTRGDMRPRMMLAELLMSSDQHTEAIAEYDQIISLNPNVDIAANNYAQIVADFFFEDKGLLTKARMIVERFARSTNPYYLDTLAWIYYRLGEYSQAQTILDRVVKFDAKLTPQIYYHYAAVLDKRGKNSEAIEYAKRATEKGISAYPGMDQAKKILETRI